MNLEEEINKEIPPCYKNNKEYSYVTIGGTLNKKTMCYYAFSTKEHCPYLKIKNNKQYCLKLEERECKKL